MKRIRLIPALLLSLALAAMSATAFAAPKEATTKPTIKITLPKGTIRGGVGDDLTITPSVPGFLTLKLYSKDGGEIATLLDHAEVHTKANTVEFSASDADGEPLAEGSYDEAIEAGSRYIEQDIVISSDGVLYVSHDENAVAMLPQPFVTVAQTKANDIRIALDMTEEWLKLQEGKENPSGMLTGVVVARTEFVKNNPEKVEKLLSDYEASVNFVNENVEEGAKLIGEYGIVAEAVAKVAIPYCKIVCIRGQEMKTLLSGYLGVLEGQNPTAIGGKLPNDDFYYGV